MKIYTIGRDPSCQIVLNDNTDIVSRRHATLQVISSSKMTITDLSSNGTYVNGMRIAKNVPVPVTRKDTISFAHLITLDWKLVPKETNYIVYIVSGGSILLAILMILFGFLYYKNHQTPDDDFTPLDNVEISNPEQKSSANNVESVDDNVQEKKSEDDNKTNNKIKIINEKKNTISKKVKKAEKAGIEQTRESQKTNTSPSKKEKEETDENNAKSMIVG